MTLLSTLKDSLKKASSDYVTLALKGFLKKDINSIYSFIDKESSIKLVFNNKFLKDYLSTLPSYITYDALDNYAITLKRYRFDYLLYTLNNQITFKLICYLDTFAIDTSAKKHFDPLPDNVNHFPDIISLAKDDLGQVIRDFLCSANLSTSTERVTAKNFIYNNFTDEQTHHNVLSLIQREKGIKSGMFLIKSQEEAIDNKGYLYDDNDSKINFQLKQVDWKELYAKNSQISVPGKEFNSDGTPLSTLLEQIGFKNIHASELDMNVDIGENAVKEFLKRKSKRQNLDEFKNV